MQKYAELHRFEIIAFQMPKSRYISLPVLRLNFSSEGFPLDDLHKILSECKWMAKVPDGQEKLWKISTG